MSRDVNTTPDEVRLGYRLCDSCEREHPSGYLVDGRCPQCRKEEPEPRRAELRREMQRSLFESTARVLRELGKPERAEWYEEQLALLDEPGGDAA